MSDSSAAVHLEAERLAALVDEPPTAAELAHLAGCAACRHEREAYVALVALARAEGADEMSDRVCAGAGPERADGDPGAWNALAVALRAEGLTERQEALASDKGGGRVRADATRRARAPIAWARRTPARLAAAVLLALGAAAAGRLSATRGPLAGGASLAAAPGRRADREAAGAFTSAEEARTALARARQEYARAAAFLAATDPSGADAVAVAGAASDVGTRADADALRARLATLDALLPRVRAAARQAPEDPAVNELYLAAYDARESALRELGRALPAGVELTGY